jgi:anti-sigma regulatory factor (Ser/Thr protein kinase)
LSGASAEVTTEFEPAPESVREARRFVTSTLEAWGADEAGDAALLTSELATNAVIHAQSRYTVTLVRLPDRVRVTVADGSLASARRCHYSPTSGTGRGLGMVADLAAAWGVETADDGKLVWFELVDPRASSAS